MYKCNECGNLEEVSDLEMIKKEFEKFPDRKLKAIVRKMDRIHDQDNIDPDSSQFVKAAVVRQAARQIILKRVASRN